LRPFIRILKNIVLLMGLTHHCTHPLRDVASLDQRWLRNAPLESESKSDHKSNSSMWKATNGSLDRLRCESPDERRNRRPMSIREFAHSWMRIALEMLAEPISMRAEMSGGFFAIPRTAWSKR
jgi:hypothetical protein